MSTSHQQSARKVQDALTSLPVADVLQAAIQFFARRGGVYTAFVEQTGPHHVTLRGQGGEEIAIGARETATGTAVTGSSYLFDQQVARFLESLPPALPAAAPAASPALTEASAEETLIAPSA